MVCLALAAFGCAGHTVPPEPAAEDWNGFWKRFQAAATSRDRAALRGIMTDKFDFTFGDGAPTPENAFSFWDKPGIHGWEALSEVAASSAVDYVPPPQWELKGKVRVAPPQAIAEGYRQWRAVFAQQSGGEWRFAAFLQGD